MSKLFFDHALLPDGWARDVTLEIDAAGRISRVEPASDGARAERPGGIAIPGLSNLHSHAFQRAMAGLGERRGPDGTEDSFWTWRRSLYHFLERITPDQLEAIAAHLYAEMLEAGFTAVAEFHYLHHDPHGRPYAALAELAARIAAAAAASGIGLTLLPVLYRHGDFGGAEPAAGQRRFLNDVDGYLRLREASAEAIASLPHAVLGCAPHSLRAVTLDELAAVTAAAGDGPMHIHIAEQVREVEDCVAWCGRRPVELLAERVALDRRWTLVHMTHVSAEERLAVAASGATAGLCPITEANLGDGVFPAADFVADGGTLGVGSDSNVEICAAGELRLLEYGQRLRDRRRALIAPADGSTGRALLELSLRGGATALARPAGALAPGRLADIVALDAEHPSLAARDGDLWLDGWIFSAGRAGVRHVWVAGVEQVRDGHHLRREALRSGYRDALRALVG